MATNDGGRRIRIIGEIMFKPYELKQTQGKKPSVSITRGGALVLSTGCISAFFKGYDYAKLFWDDDNSKVGIKPMKKKDNFSYSLSYSKNRRVGWLSGKSFLKNIGIEYKETTVYPAVWNEKERLVEFAVTASSSV